MANYELWLMRHGETAWSLSGQHTSRTDLELTPNGIEKAMNLKKMLAGKKFACVLTSPMKRAVETCRLAGYADQAVITPDLSEWNYGDYEGLTSDQIREMAPGWTIWTGNPPGGETNDQVAARAERIIQMPSTCNGDVGVFGHGHMLRVLAACWLGLPPDGGKYFALSTGSISVLGYERDTRVIRLWNQTPS